MNNSHSGVTMRLLLINNNPAVSRLLKLSVEKAGHEMDEFEEYGLVPLKSYDIIMIDNELYDESELLALKEQTHCDYCIYVCQRGSAKPDDVNVTLEKPFLPTDFLILLEKVKNVIESHRSQSAEVISLDDDDENALEETSAFDIDSINGLDEDEDEDMLSLNHTEEPDEDGEDENAIVDTPLEDDDEMKLSTFDLDTKDEELELELPLADTNEVAQDFDFNPEQAEDTLDEEIVQNAPSVLDKDDIDEVKQLLDDDENENEETFDFEDVSLNTSSTEAEEDSDLTEEEGQEETSLSVKEDESESLGSMFEEVDDALLLAPDEDYSIEDELDSIKAPLETQEDSVDDFEEEQEDNPLSLDTLEKDEPMSLDSVFEDIGDEALLAEAAPFDTTEDTVNDEETFIETQEEIIDDFEEEIAEQNEDEIEDKEDSIATSVAVEVNNANDVSSLDELNENLIKKAFGEEVDEENIPEIQEASQEIEVIRGEIENSISKSIASFAQSDILREALKGMKINISITFDDKN